MVEKWQGLERSWEVKEYMLLNCIEKWGKASDGEWAKQRLTEAERDGGKKTNVMDCKLSKFK